MPAFHRPARLLIGIFNLAALVLSFVCGHVTGAWRSSVVTWESARN